MTVAEKFRIMIVDDSPNDIHLLMNSLKDDYQLNAATSAADAFKLLEKSTPDLILLDVNMPDMDGYEACVKLKESPEHADIDIIFLSANDSTEEIVRGLALGAIDYIVKPYDPKLLQTKIRTAQNTHKSKLELKKQAAEVNQLVYTMMSETGSLSTTIQYFRECFSATAPKGLLESTIDTFKTMGLSAVTYFNLDQEQSVLSTLGEPSMLETELLTRLVGYSSPIFEQGERLFVIQKYAVVLIKNMPTDADKRGSLKDHMMILMEGTNAKLSYFNQLAIASGEKVKTIAHAIDSAKTELSDVQHQQETYKKESMSILDEMVAEVEESFFSMGLTDTQESQMLQILSKSVNLSLKHMEEGLKMDQRTNAIVKQLSDAATNAAR